MSLGGKVACVFPGQGSQYVGMGRQLYEAFPQTRALLEEGGEVLGMDLKGLCLEGPEELLVLTANTQPAILAVSTMAWTVLKDHGISPDFVAGHSLGEYSALVAADSMRYLEALQAVRRRGELMQEAVAVGAGAMAAIIGLPLEEIGEICREAAQGEVVEVANLNTPVQTVVAGQKTAVERAMAAAKARGAKRIQPLPVSAPFHCRLMRPIAQEFAQVLARLEIRDPRIPLIATRDAEPKATAAAVIQSLVEQLSYPVRWVEVVRRLIQEGVQTFIEVGPGKVLSGLITRIDGEVKVCQVQDPESLEEGSLLPERLPQRPPGASRCCEANSLLEVLNAALESGLCRFVVVDGLQALQPANAGHAAQRVHDLGLGYHAMMQPVGDMLAGDAAGRAIFHQAHIIDVGHLGAAHALVDPAHHIAQDALRIVVQFLLDLLGRPLRFRVCGHLSVPPLHKPLHEIRRGPGGQQFHRETQIQTVQQDPELLEQEPLHLEV